MATFDADQLFGFLLQSEPSAILTWLDQSIGRSVVVPADFNWLGMAEVAAMNAREELNLTWATIAIRIYEYLANGATSEMDTLSSRLSAMMLRIFMILQLGAQKGDIILDPDHLVHNFYTYVTLSQEQVEESIALGTTRSREQTLELRHIKNYLSALNLLAAQGMLRSYPDLESWFLLIPLLP